jgi:hypothetical protein
MYFDTKPCQVCGADVELRPRDVDAEPLAEPGAERVAEPDATVDQRVCTNADCETNRPGRAADAPRP